MSLYEGRTRGKRIKYTFSDDEAGQSDEQSSRRSNRQSGLSTPAEPAAPRFTASGRQVRSRYAGEYGESSTEQRRTPNPDGVSTMELDGDDEEPTRGRPRHGRVGRPRKVISDYESMDESDSKSDGSVSSNEWKGGDDDDEADAEDDEDEDLDLSEEDFENEDVQKGSLVVRLHYGKGQSSSPQPAPNPSNQAITNGSSAPQEPVGYSVSQKPDQPMPDLSSNLKVNGMSSTAPSLAKKPTEILPPISHQQQTHTTLAMDSDHSPPPSTFDPLAYRYVGEATEKPPPANVGQKSGPHDIEGSTPVPTPHHV